MNYPPKSEKIDISRADNWVTNYDAADLPENYILDGRGIRPLPEMIFVRDFGTKHRFANYPSVPGTITIIDGFTLYDVASSTEYEMVVGLDTNSHLHIYVNDSVFAGANPGTVNNWIELTRYFNAQINSIVDYHTASLNNITDSLNNSYSFVGTSDIVNYIVFNSEAAGDSRVSFITAMPTSSQIRTSSAINAGGLNWSAGNHLTIFRDFGLFDFFLNSAKDISLGATPHIRWSAVEAQSKVNILLGTSASPPVMAQPFRIQRIATNRSAFWDKTVATAPRLTIPANWYLEKGCGGLSPAFYSYGSAAAPLTPPGTQQAPVISDPNGNSLIRLKFTPSESVSGDTHIGLRVAMTLVYDNYQESDPVFKAYLKADDGYIPQFNLDELAVNYGRFPKNVTSFRFYGAAATASVVYAGWPDEDTGYSLMMEIPIYSSSFLWVSSQVGFNTNTGGWNNDQTTEYSYQFVPDTSGIAYGAFQYVIINLCAGNATLGGSLGHAVDVTRKYYTPRFSVRAAREQGVYSVIDIDDKTLLISTLDGAGVIEDDNFVEESVDNVDNRLRIFLNGHGELAGLVIMRDMVYAFRKTEYEVYDLASGNQRIATCDFLSKRSLVMTPHGVLWAGTSGIWFLPIDGGEPELLNSFFRNWYDGTLTIDNGKSTTPYILAAYRSAIIAGYDQTFDEVWFHVQANVDTEFGGGAEYLCLRYNFDLKNWIVPRKIETGAINFFTRRTIDTEGSLFSIGYASGILSYPARTSGVSLYKDGIAYGGSGGTSLTTRITINFGSLHAFYNPVVLDQYLVDVDADTSADASAVFNIDWFANEEVSAFCSATQLGVVRAFTRKFRIRGQLEQVRVRISLPAASTIARFSLSKVVIIFVRQQRYGNR